MSFKIVAFIKKRKNAKRVAFSYVPEQWEKNGKVYWPTTDIEVQRIDKNSVPQEGWSEHKAVVKKANIQTLEEAKLWEDQFLLAENTDAENELTIEPTQKSTINSSITKKAKIKTINQNQYELLFNNNNNMTVQAQSLETPIFTTPEIGRVNQINEKIPDNNNYVVVDDVILHTACVEEIEKLKQENEKLEVENNTLKLMLSSMEHNVKTITIFTEKTYSLLRDHVSNENQPVPVAELAEKEFENTFTFPIITSNDLSNFNKEIEGNEKYLNHLIQKYAKIGGCEGRENGDKIGRQLISLFFSPTILMTYSWTGISRSNGIKKKIPFQNFSGILNLFSVLLKKADCRWNEALNIKFFKEKILKHSKQISATFEKNKKKKLEAIGNNIADVQESRDNRHSEEEILSDNEILPDDDDSDDSETLN